MMMLLALMAQSAVTMPPTPPSLSEKRFNQCVALVASQPLAAQKEAESWRDTGGGTTLAMHCLGLALVAQERYAAAAIAFRQAAAESVVHHDGRASYFYVQAGNAFLAGDDPVNARTAFDEALAAPTLGKAQKGEVYLDRARASVLLNDYAAARTDIDMALALVSLDPMAWLLSATLARRMDDLPRARRDMDKAMGMVPNDPAILYEQGNIAWQTNDVAEAKRAWEKAVQIGKDSIAAQSAQAALDSYFEQGPSAAPAPAAAPVAAGKNP